MKVKVIAPQQIEKCTIELPPSKSIANRVLIMSALNGIKPNKVLTQPLSSLCDDIRVMVELLENPQANIVDVGAAGTAMRFATAYLAVQKGTCTITGTPRLQQRPIGILVDALKKLGAEIEYVANEGFPPLKITGNSTIKGGTITLDGGVSSQFISALLMIAPMLEEGLTIKLEGNLVSIPYINITIGLMKQFGAKAKWIDERTVMVEHGYSFNPANENVNVEADWTAASYWYEIASIAQAVNPSEIFTLPHLLTDSIQGDKVCNTIYSLLEENRKNNTTFVYDFEDCPDLVQTVVVTCCINAINFRFTGLRTLRIKETDRISALQIELAKLGYRLEATDDSLTWDGSQTDSDPRMAVIATYHDHRMAMAFAPCAIHFGEITIDDPDVVTKSYPSYWNDLEKVGFKLSFTES